MVLFYFLLQIKGKPFFLEIDFSEVSILPSFEISITGLKTVWRLQPPVPVLLPLCQQTYLSFALVGNFYLLVKLLLQDCFDALAQQKILNCKDNSSPVFLLNAEKVRICEIMSGGFAVEIQQCVKNVRRFLVTFSLC